MNKIKKQISETPYINCYCTLSHEMIRIYWTAIREPLMEDTRDTVYNMLVRAD